MDNLIEIDETSETLNQNDHLRYLKKSMPILKIFFEILSNFYTY